MNPYFFNENNVHVYCLDLKYITFQNRVLYTDFGSTTTRITQMPERNNCELQSLINPFWTVTTIPLLQEIKFGKISKKSSEVRYKILSEFSVESRQCCVSKTDTTHIYLQRLNLNGFRNTPQRIFLNYSISPFLQWYDILMEYLQNQTSKYVVVCTFFGYILICVSLIDFAYILYICRL